ncbi:MAG: ABC transporter permease, partial [Acidobacteriaceae bacterium]|nr:ABC transporter permease [Acidobacteriaceae bacterium]
MSPSLGRDFSPREEHFGGPNAVLISDRFWRRRLHADPNILRKQLRIEAYSYTIIGVMPASFLFPDHDVDVWLPNPMDAPYAQDRNETWFQVIGRLRPNVSIAQARADLATVQAQLGRQFPKSDGTLGVRVEALKETTVAGIRRSLWVLFGSVSLLLLIACTNIAALLLARTTEREREIAVRFSLGASRLSIIVQLLTECLVLALIGCAVGLSVAAAGARTLHHLASSIPRAEEVTLDWRVVLYTVACAVLATLLCGLLPAIRGTRQSIATNLGHASRTQVSARNPMQWILVGVQVSLAVTLLVGAGLLLRSFQELGRVSPGFDPTHVLTLRISGNWGETTDYKKVIQRIDRSLDQLRATPGVRAAATSAVMPGAAGELEGDFKIDTQLTHAGKKIVADSRWVSNGYFEAMRIPLLTGEGCPRALVSAA